jgi:hypothetical protein
MIERNRLFLLAAFAIAIPVMAAGCNRQPVTAQNAMPDKPSLSPADNRKEMIKWHQQHDKLPDAASAAAQSKN